LHRDPEPEHPEPHNKTLKLTVKIGDNPNRSTLMAATALNLDRRNIRADKAYGKAPGLTPTDQKTHG